LTGIENVTFSTAWRGSQFPRSGRKSSHMPIVSDSLITEAIVLYREGYAGVVDEKHRPRGIAVLPVEGHVNSQSFSTVF
jgi:hypothetical protein